MVVLDEQSRVLLVRHTYQLGWHLPGGKVEKGETVLESAEREVREETGFDTSRYPKELLGVFANFGEYKYDHVVVFVVRGVEGQELRSPPFEIEESGFFSAAALPAGATNATQRRVAESMGQASVDGIW